MSSKPSEAEPLWTKILADFRESNLSRSILEIALTGLPFLALWIAMGVLVTRGFWWGIVLAVPAAAFLVRLFMIQHDCGHGAFFGSRRANDWVGRLISVATLTPYDQWRRTHAGHHAAVGNLDRRGIGDIRTMTVREYLAASGSRRLGYRFIRHPLILFGLGPAFLFLLQNRVPIHPFRESWRAWTSPMLTNLAVAAVVVLICLAIGPTAFVAIHLPVILLSATVGVWLFYVQHQFEETVWQDGPEWSHSEASLHGSSFYDLPQPLRWFTADIGIHHVHHLSSKIPFYRLADAMEAHPDLKVTGRLTLWTSLRCIPLALWDEESGRLVSFRGMRALVRQRGLAAMQKIRARTTPVGQMAEGAKG
jgi:omega-6 fatty acid desaturase (delta-12 desaturase)